MQTKTSSNHSQCQNNFQEFTERLARSEKSVTTSDIEKYVQNLWHAEEEPFLYATD